MGNKNIVLSISMLISNRIDTIKKCMESIKPLLTQIPCELIAVDTIGEENSDGSLDVVKEYATEIVHFDWCNDFSKARNCGLERCSGEWFMFMDDDEWFEDVTELVEFFKSGEYVRYCSATHRMRNYTDKEGRNYNEVTLLRLIRKEKNTRFVGVIHEAISEVFLPCKDFSFFSHHYGYAFANETEKMTHIKRNAALLQDVVKKSPKDMRYRTQMALELATYDNEGALAFCKETFTLCEDQKETPGFQRQLSLVFSLYEALGISVALARESYTEWKNRYGFSETAENAICFQMVRIHILSGEPAGAYPYSVRYFETLLFLQEHPEKQQLQMTADFYRYQSEVGQREMLRFGAYCAGLAKEYESAWTWYALLPWEREDFIDEEIFYFMIELTKENVNTTLLVSIIKRLLKNKSMMEKAFVKNSVAAVLKWIKNSETEKDKLEPNWIKSNVKLTIGILVSNNIGTIRRCLDSLKPILEAIPSELIVVDTVGEKHTDGSLMVAKEYATTLLHFDWCNDFAAARNCFMKAASGEWLLFVDDDEWFSDTTEFIEFFQNGECYQYGNGQYPIRSYSSSGPYEEVLVGRFFRRTPTMRFVGTIHEQINEIYAPSKIFSTYAHHMGYVYASKEEEKKHQERNTEPLKKALEKGYTPRLCAQYVQELYSVEETRDEGYQTCLKFLPVLVEEQGTITNPATQWLLLATARYYMFKEDYEGLKKQVELLKKNYQMSQLTQLYLAAILLFEAKNRGDFAVIEQESLNYISAWEWFTAHPGEEYTQSILDMRQYFNMETLCEILWMGAWSANKQKKYELAKLYWQLFPWNGAGQKLTQYKAEMERTLQGFKDMLK